MNPHGEALTLCRRKWPLFPRLSSSLSLCPRLYVLAPPPPTGFTFRIGTSTLAEVVVLV